MVRMLESEEVLTRSEQDVRVDMRKDSASPTAEEVRAIVHGPRRPIRWMRWLGVAVLVIATAMVVTYATTSDEADLVRYQTPASVDATTEALTRSVYLPETSGEVYNHNPATLASMLTRSVYLPETSGEVYNHNPVSSEVADLVRYQVPASVDATDASLTTPVYLPVTSGEVYNYNPATVAPASAVYLPETSGEVYNYNPATVASMLTSAVYLPVTSGEAYNYNPATVASMLTRSVYLPVTSGEVFNYNPATLASMLTRSVYLPVTSGEVYNYNPGSE